MRIFVLQVNNIIFYQIFFLDLFTCCLSRRKLVWKKRNPVSYRCFLCEALLVEFENFCIAMITGYLLKPSKTIFWVLDKKKPQTLTIASRQHQNWVIKKIIIFALSLHSIHLYLYRRFKVIRIRISLIYIESF